MSVYQEPACDALLTFSIDGISRRKKGREPKLINREGGKKKKKKSESDACLLSFLIGAGLEEYWRG